MKKIALFFVFSLLTRFTFSQTVVSVTQIASKTATQVSSVLGSSSGPYFSVKIYKVHYNTTDPFGNNTVASGAVFIPNACDSFPLVAYCHGTVLRKTQVPSQQYDSNYEGLFFAGKGYVVAMPDYLGLGDNAGYHPYLHSQTEATSTVDLMRAVREYLADSTSLHLNGEVFVTGYSQGGHAAMATLKYIQENNLTTEFNVVAGGPMSGPYSLSRVQVTTIYDSVYSYNGFSPYVINSYQYVYSNLYDSVSQYYDAPYSTTIPPYLNGLYTFDQLNVVLPTNIYDFMQDSILDAFIADSITFSTPLRHDLMLNDNYAWNASMPIKMCYCGSDDLVLPGNSLVAADSMTAHGSISATAVNINQAGDHFTCFTPAITYVRTWFNSLRTDCNVISGVNELSPKSLDYDWVAFPNPSSNFIGIKANHLIKEIELLDATGKSVYKVDGLNKTDIQLAVGNYCDGSYTLKLTGPDGVASYKRVVILKHN